MKIKNLLQDVLVEEVKNKKLFNDLLTKWRVQKPHLSVGEAETIFNRFQELKAGLNPNRPQVMSFLYRFDGKHGYERFDPDLLKDITKYSYRQITSLIDEYTDNDDVDAAPVANAFADKSLKSTPDKVAASKEMWKDKNSALVNEEDFRVYDIENQAMAIRFGYYLEEVRTNFTKQIGTNSRWCVTWRNTSEPGDGGSNMWGSYRSQGRSFYFVIDETRDEKDRYFMGALQRVSTNKDGYILTSIKNDGDTSFSWDEILKIYPKLAPYKDRIVPKKYSTEELEEKNVVGQINEVETNPYEFKRVDRQLKKAYINNQGVLRKPESWKAMDEKLRALYIVTTTEQQIRNKFSNFEFIDEIRKVGNEFTLLDNRLKQLGHKDGVGFILGDLIKHEFRLVRESLNNPQIKIYESKVTGFFGIYNARIGSWLKFDNLVYEPLFKQTDTDVYFDEEETGFFVEKYDQRNGNVSFYCIYPSETELGDCYILSQKKWEELKPRLYMDKEDIPRVSNFDKENDVDIKEVKKKI